MATTEFLAVKNFEAHQHYRNRRPPWIKLHAALLEDYAFSCLHDASKAHLMLIWLLASKLDNRIPNDPEWITRQIGANAPLDLQSLIAHGFLIVVQGASSRIAVGKHISIVETEAETKTESRAKKGEGGKYSETFEEIWRSYPKRAGGENKHDAWLQFQARIRAGESTAAMLDGVKRYAAYCSATEKIGSEFVKQAKTFLGKSRHYLESWEIPTSSVNGVSSKVSEFWAIVKTSGIHHTTTIEQFDADLAKLAASGVVANSMEFKEKLRLCDLRVLRAVQDDRQAHAHIAQRWSAKAAA